MLNLPKKVTVVEVGPRDGLQSFPNWVETDTKVEMIDRLSAVGYPVIEVTNFAHPKVIPNLSDAEEVMARIKRRPGTVYRALVPNARGAERAAKTDCDEMLGLITVSKTYLAKNQNMERDEAIDQGVKAFEIAEKAGAKFIMALGMALWCPLKVGSTKMIPWPSLNGTTMPASGVSISPGPSAWKTRGTSTRYSPARPSVSQTRISAGTSTTSPAWGPPTSLLRSTAAPPRSKGQSAASAVEL